MDEYIKKEAVLDLFGEVPAYTGYETYPVGVHTLICEIAPLIKDEIRKIPAADVAPVRHGRWIEPQRLYYGAKQYECSLCYSDKFWKKHGITEKYPHCPNCGAKMDGGADNG